MKVENIYYQCL